MLRVTLLVVTLFAAVLSGILAAPKSGHAQLIQRDGLVRFPQPLPVSDFRFIDENGQPLVPADLSGRWQLLFFGYTYCPDICPMTLTHLNRSWKQLSAQQQQQLGVVMVSVDPQRDSAESLSSYMDYFNPEFRALTGNPQALQTLASELHAVYSRVDRADGQAYLMDHSANLAILDPQGRYRGYMAPPHDPQRRLPLLNWLLDDAAS